MVQTTSEIIENGWRQIRAGLGLIVWSRLASWNQLELTLAPADNSEFESNVGWRVVHDEFGRLLCWIAFSVGSEYIAKGTFMSRGQDSTNMEFGSLPWSRVLERSDRKSVAPIIKSLAREIRNRDVHRYSRNVRASHLLDVESRFVPALNVIFASFDQEELRKQTVSVGR
jgi:hypothetical protein